MGTPGDGFPVDKVVQDLEAHEESESQSDMTVLRNIPSLGIFIEQSLENIPKDELMNPEPALTLLGDLESQLLTDVTDVTDVPLFDEPVAGPSGLQTPKAAKQQSSSSCGKIAPKRNKKPPVSCQTPKKPHTCSVCDKSFQSSAKLVSHQLVHGGGTPFKCEHCKKSFSSKFKLVRHVLIHSDRKPFSCTVCERTFHRKDHLKNHIKVHSPSKKIYTCERSNCKKEYTSVMSYRKHLALHSAEEGSLECKICLKTFETKADIMYHLKIHAGSRTVKNPNEKKFTCDHCDRRFFTRKDVRRHLVVHTGTRNFLCQFCPQRFGRKDHLVRHIKKSHSKNYTEVEVIEVPETKTEPEPMVMTKTELPEPNMVVTKTELPEITGVPELTDVTDNILRTLTDLSPMLCSDAELNLPLPSDSELLCELEQQTEQFPTDIIGSDILRLIETGSTDDESNLPLPGFSQAFQQPPPSSS